MDRLERLPLQDEINILVMGETGVGKSTWVNAFVNYIEFGSLDDAVRSEKDFIVAIPSQFTITDDEGDLKTIKIGEPDVNEVDSRGQPSTQKTRDYYVQLRGGSKMIRLIDTPGIGDVRGIDQDKINLSNILRFLGNFERIHGICFLLKSNEARLSISFRYCLGELLKRLDKSAQNSIAFCFTNSRGTFYRPGETKIVLSELLKQIRQKTSGISLDITNSNTFCMDNEAFRFLAASKNGITFEDTVKDLYSKSWNQAVESTAKLLEFICKSDSHNMKKSLSLNNARNLILTLLKPMAEILVSISKTTLENERKIKELKACEGDIEYFKAQLNFIGKTFEKIDLPTPKMVCTNSNCKQSYLDKSADERITIYKPECHPKCNCLKGISTGLVGESGILKCKSFVANPEYCSQCGHHYREHMYLTYELRPVKQYFQTEGVKNVIVSRLSDKDEIEEGLRINKHLIQELVKEENDCLEIGAKFASFLIHNAIVPYNDGLLDFLNLWLKEECDYIDRQDILVEKLQKTIELYINKKKTFEDALANVDDETKLPTAEEIGELASHLFSLKYYGKYFDKFNRDTAIQPVDNFL